MLICEIVYKGLSHNIHSCISISVISYIEPIFRIRKLSSTSFFAWVYLFITKSQIRSPILPFINPKHVTSIFLMSASTIFLCVVYPYNHRGTVSKQEKRGSSDWKHLKFARLTIEYWKSPYTLCRLPSLIGIFSLKLSGRNVTLVYGHRSNSTRLALIVFLRLRFNRVH